ncbi:MAG: hypothetical protein ABW023_00395 [Sphingomonas sp.]
MLKTILLATSVLVAAPAFAQDKPATTTTQTQDQTATPNQTASDPAAATPADAVTTAQATPQTTPAPQTEAAQPTPSQPAEQASAQPAAQPAPSQDQVAQAVSRDFGTYDKDANGSLSQAEFGAWIGALRKAAEPGFQPSSPDGQTYIGQAFAATDTNKNKSVDKTELTTFLTPKPA